MLGLRKKRRTWTVVCKSCGHKFPAPVDRQTLDSLTDFNAYQCPLCGESGQYARSEHEPAA